MWHLDQLHRLMSRAIADGAVPQDGMPHKLAWDCFGTCETPVTREIHGRGDGGPLHNAKWSLSPGSATLIMRVPCRKCAGCLRYKASLWRGRARQELAASNRTWLLSLTNSPEAHYRALCEISVAQRKKGVPLSLLDDRELFKLRTAHMGASATRFIKRLRKRGSSFRYLLVSEAHKSGLPHLHALLHETGGPVRKADIQSEWIDGFSGCKLVDSHQNAAFYVTKYVAKSMLTRVRASIGYGKEMRPEAVASLASVVASHLLEDGNLSNLKLHRYI